MSHSDTIPLHSSSQSDIDEIENLINSHPSTVLPAHPPSPLRASIPVSSSPFIPSNLPPPSVSNVRPAPAPPIPQAPPLLPSSSRPTTGQSGIDGTGFGSSPNTLTEPVWDTVKRDLARIVSNLKLVVFPNPFREDPGKALRDWDLWGPFFFIVFLGLTLSWSASVKKVNKLLGEYVSSVRVALKILLSAYYAYFQIVGGTFSVDFGVGPLMSEVFAVAFALLAAGAVILTLNVLLLGGHIIFFQSLSLLGYCLFPLDVGALICMVMDNVIVKLVVVGVTLGWSSWAAYPFMSTAVTSSRKALALYPVLLMYVSVGFLIIAID